jgi:group II intron reverse transcriptase/maturase
MAPILSGETVYTKLQRVAKLAREAPDMVLTTMAHHIDVEWLLEAYRRTRKDGAPGVDGQSAQQYRQNLEVNLESLLSRAKSGSYRAPPVRRVNIPKGTRGETRPIGVPTFEDKVLQRAVVMLLEAVYEQDFLDCSYGFRPKRSQHQALESLREAVMGMKGGWVLEVDIRRFYDTLAHHHIREIVRQRVQDGVLLRLISKWLHAGVMQDGELSYPEQGSPQGGVVSPLLANVYLHHVIDEWFAQQVQPRLKGKAQMVRYADDIVMVFASEQDALRVKEVLPKRLEKYGLSLHPDKTKLVRFTRPSYGPRPGRDEPPDPGTFDMLGFTHYWGKSRRGAWVVKRRTAKDRLKRAIHKASQWCKRNRHLSVEKQWRYLCEMLRGHDAYYGIACNMQALKALRQAVNKLWRKWLGRRSNRSRMSWARMRRLLERYPLPRCRIVHRAHPYCAARLYP